MNFHQGDKMFCICRVRKHVEVQTKLFKYAKHIRTHDVHVVCFWVCQAGINPSRPPAQLTALSELFGLRAGGGSRWSSGGLTRESWYRSHCRLSRTQRFPLMGGPENVTPIQETPPPAPPPPPPPAIIFTYFISKCHRVKPTAQGGFIKKALCSSGWKVFDGSMQTWRSDSSST